MAYTPSKVVIKFQSTLMISMVGVKQYCMCNRKFFINRSIAQRGYLKIKGNFSYLDKRFLKFIFLLILFRYESYFHFVSK